MTRILWPVLAVALGAGCAATHLDRSFAAPDLHDGPFKHIVTIAMTHDHARRVAMEDALTGQLARAGVQAEASYKTFTDEALQSQDSLRDLLTKNGFDGAVVMRVTNTSREDVWVPSTITVIPVFYRTVWDYYTHWKPVVFEPAYMANDRAVHVETVLFEVPEGDLIYSAISQTLNPASAEDLVRQVGDRVAKDLAAKGLIGNSHPHN